MNTELRNRAVLPVLLPLGVIAAVVAVVGGLALILLYNTRVVALAIALVVAAGVMVAMSLASSLDEEDMTMARKAVISAAALLPLLGGLGVSLWAANGGVAAEELNINRVPHLIAPEGAEMAAQNSQTFCDLPEEGEGCEDTDTIEMPAAGEGEPFMFLFENLEANIPHNVQIFASEGGELLFSGATITGPDETVYTVEEGLPVGSYYYNCIVHPNMAGTLEIVEAE